MECGHRGCSRGSLFIFKTRWHFPLLKTVAMPPPTGGGLARGAGKGRTPGAWQGRGRERRPHGPPCRGAGASRGQRSGMRRLHDLVAAADALHEAAGKGDAQDLQWRQGLSGVPQCPPSTPSPIASIPPCYLEEGDAQCHGCHHHDVLFHPGLHGLETALGGVQHSAHGPSWDP